MTAEVAPVNFPTLLLSVNLEYNLSLPNDETKITAAIENGPMLKFKITSK
jgi:hypothetical protein